MSDSPFRSRKQRKIWETGLMREVTRRTLDAHTEGGLCVWTGPSRIGKSTTATRLEARLNTAYSPDDPNAFRARLFAVTGDGVQRASVRLIKRGMRALYTGIAGPLDERIYRRCLPQELAAMTVDVLKRRSIELVFVDEAGTLTVDELRGIVAVWDEATAQGWQLTVVLIGMDDLVSNMERLKQVKGRIQEWCFFEPYDLEDTRAMLGELSPHFAKLDPRNADAMAQVEAVHMEYGGIPGAMVPFLRLLDRRLREYGGVTVDHLFIQAVMLDLRSSRSRAVEFAKSSYARGPDKDAETPVEASKPSKAKSRGATK